MWQRFTERARKVILLGQEEAQRMGSPRVDTEHLLLGLVREQEGVAAQVLDKMGARLSKIRAALEGMPPTPAEPPSAEPKLTPRAKRVLELAADEARRIKHNYIGTEHLLLALLREQEGVAAQMLKQFGLTLEKARQEVMEYLGPEEAKSKAHGIAARAERVGREIGVCLSPLARRALLRAADKALGTEAQVVEFEHLLAAVRELEQETSQGGQTEPGQGQQSA